MVTSKFLTLARIGPALALLSCAAPKARVVEPPKPPGDSAAVVDPALPDLGALPSQDRGIRLPDMLGLPGDAEFRTTSPLPPKNGGSAGAVISRPPTDPPSRPKPKPAGNE